MLSNTARPRSRLEPAGVKFVRPDTLLPRWLVSLEKQRVFVVDDEPVIATTLGLIFRHAGYESSTYNDPLDLLLACERLVPHVVVSDVMMPNTTGIDLARRLEELYPECKVILISGQAATADLLQEAQSQGRGFEVLGKPVAPALLVEHVRKALLS